MGLPGLRERPRAGSLPQALEVRAVRAGTVTVRVRAALPAGFCFRPTPAAELTLRHAGSAVRAAFSGGVAEAPLEVGESAAVELEVAISYCRESAGAACRHYRAARILPLRVAADGADEVSLRLAVDDA